MYCEHKFIRIKQNLFHAHISQAYAVTYFRLPYC